MGLPALERLMALQRGGVRRRRRARAPNGSTASAGAPCQQDEHDDSQGGKRMRYSVPELPEDILQHIHSLLPLRDAARAACLSRAFLHSWRCHPNLTLNRNTLGSEAYPCEGDFSDKIDRILRNHSGKILKLELNDISCHFLDSWLRLAVTPGIEELTVVPCRHEINYNFPCSLLSDGIRNSIRYLHLGFCAFHPTTELGPLRSLTSLHLRTMHITGDELECLLSNALALEQLVLIDCKGIIRLKIPFMLQQLSYLKVSACRRLQIIECKAPNLSSLYLTGKAKLLLGETLQMKNVTMFRSKVICYARTKLPSIMPNLEILDIRSQDEVVDTPMLHTKFLCLKHLSICMRSGWGFSPSYDYFSLVSFLDASPSLETLFLDVSQQLMKHDSVVGPSPHLRQMPEHRHCCLKSVKIFGFSSAKGMVELACYILKNAVSLESLTLGTLYGSSCFGENGTNCHLMSDGIRTEAPRAVAAIRGYIEDKVPTTVKLTVLESCTRCHVKPEGSL